MSMEKTKPSFSELIQGDTPVLVDFYADWCGPCKMMAPILQDTASKFGDALKIVKIDVDRNPAVSGHYSVSAVPTLILFKRGKIVWRKAGVASGGELAQVIGSVSGV
jgi:thioredoxin 1